MSWVDGPMLAFDTETSGVDEDALVLSSTLVHYDPDTREVNTSTDLLNHGQPVPPESTAIHGLTDEILTQHGTEPGPTLHVICSVMASVMSVGTPLVGMNLQFDLTRLDRNCRRYGVPTLSDRMEGGEIWPVLDAMVLDKGCDRYRKGQRRLQGLASLYRVPWDEEMAHTSEADALAAARVVWRIGRMYPPLAALSLREVHDLQRLWKRSQDVSFASYLRRQDSNRDLSDLDGAWPVRLPRELQPAGGLW